MIILHHLNNSRSQRVLWLLEELGLPYQIVRYQRDPKTMLAPPSLKAVHPLGKSPVIVDGELTLAESGAIIEYLADRYAQTPWLGAPGTAQRLANIYWLHYAEGSLMPLLLLKLVFQRVATAPAPFFVRPVIKGVAGKANQTFIHPQLSLQLDYLEQSLGEQPWFGGDHPTAADIQLSYPLEAAAARAGLDRSRPQLWAWLERVHARPAYQRALQQGGEFTLAS